MAMNQGRLAAYAAGNKVYGGGRPNPTSGPVDPTGYVERSANGAASNRRSGLASAAMRRIGGGTPATQGKTGGSGVLQPAAARRAQQVMQAEAVKPPAVQAPPSMYNPIELADGRRLAPDATGRFKFIDPQPQIMDGV